MNSDWDAQEPFTVEALRCIEKIQHSVEVIAAPVARISWFSQQFWCPPLANKRQQLPCSQSAVLTGVNFRWCLPECVRCSGRCENTPTWRNPSRRENFLNVFTRMTAPRPLQCGQCFNDASILRRHRLAKHPGTDPNFHALRRRSGAGAHGNFKRAGVGGVKGPRGVGASPAGGVGARSGGGSTVGPGGLQTQETSGQDQPVSGVSDNRVPDTGTDKESTGFITIKTLNPLEGHVDAGTSQQIHVFPGQLGPDPSAPPGGTVIPTKTGDFSSHVGQSLTRIGQHGGVEQMLQGMAPPLAPDPAATGQGDRGLSSIIVVKGLKKEGGLIMQPPVQVPSIHIQPQQLNLIGGDFSQSQTAVTAQTDQSGSLTAVTDPTVVTAGGSEDNAGQQSNAQTDSMTTVTIETT